MTMNKRSDWRWSQVAVVFVLLWILLWYRQTAAAMVGIWARSDTFMHGFLVVPIVLWLVWRQRHVLLAITPRPDARLLIPLGVVGLGWLLGELASVNAVTQLALVSLLVLAVPAVLGMEVASAIAFPLGFLFFAVPIGEFVMPQLMEWTASFTVIGLRLTGIPVYREGLQFVIPSGTWSVVEACSGVRYLIASLTVGTLFAYLNYYSLKRRLIFIAFSAAVPIVANWMRAYMIVMLGHLSGNKLAAGVDHLIYGWVFFGIVILLMFLIGARWTENLPAGANEDPAASSRHSSPTVSTRTGMVVAAVAVLCVLPHLGIRAIEGVDESRQAMVATPVSLNLPGGWRETLEQGVGWRPVFENPSAELHTTFLNEERRVGLYVGYYRKQDFNRKLVSSTNVLVKSKDPVWAMVNSGSRDITFDQQPVTVRTAELRGAGPNLMPGGERLAVWHWYWINGHLTASDYQAKVYTALSRLQGQGDDSAVIVLYAPKDQPGGADGALEAFSLSAGRAIEDALQNLRQQQ